MNYEWIITFVALVGFLRICDVRKVQFLGFTLEFKPNPRASPKAKGLPQVTPSPPGD